MRWFKTVTCCKSEHINSSEEWISGMYTVLFWHVLREQPFDFYGGWRKTSQKKFLALISGKKNSPAQRAGKKNSSAWLRKRFRTPKLVFTLQNPPFAVWNLLSQSKICFSHSVNCFTPSKSTCTLYLGNDFLHHKKEVFLGKRKILKKNSGKCRTWMWTPPLPTV